MPPVSSIDASLSKLAIASNKPVPDKFKLFVVASKETLVFVP